LPITGLITDESEAEGIEVGEIEVGEIEVGEVDEVGEAGETDELDEDGGVMNARIFWLDASEVELTESL
jgi:hypothetical protein